VRDTIDERWDDYEWNPGIGGAYCFNHKNGLGLDNPDFPDSGILHLLAVGHERTLCHSSRSVMFNRHFVGDSGSLGSSQHSDRDWHIWDVACVDLHGLKMVVIQKV